MKQTITSRLMSLIPSGRALVALMCILMLAAAPLPASAQRHGAGERTERRKDNKHNNSDRHRGGQNHRPDKGNGKRPDSGKRPDKGDKKNIYRPGAAGNNRPAPGHGAVAPSRPGHNNGNHNRPSPGPSHNWNPGRPNHVKPGHHIHRPPVAPPPHRPYRPAHFFGFHRPVPPPAWRPGPRPLFSTVLGLTFGTALSVGIDALITGGYAVDGYTDDMVYVNDAVQLNMRWPFGVLRYDNGLLTGSEFAYSSDWRDLNRYNMAYARLSSLYGPPVSAYNNGNDISATWWGPGGQYIILRFDYRAPVSGRNRYFTTLSFGI